jgi:FixJ family two-component response regulator
LEAGLSEKPLVSIVGDNESVSWAVAGIIGSAGFRALVFPSAEEFIASGQMARSACLVVDVQLRGMSGLQLQSHLASSGRHIPMVFIVALADERSRALATKLGAVNILEKPSGEKTLLKEISMILKPRDKD